MSAPTDEFPPIHDRRGEVLAPGDVVTVLGPVRDFEAAGATVVALIGRPLPSPQVRVVDNRGRSMHVDAVNVSLEHRRGQ